jgi:hypothetical protein
MITITWDRRRAGETSPAYLARVLDWLGLDDMAARAREGCYDDFNAPSEVATGFEMLTLVRELEARKRDLDPLRRARVRMLIEAVLEGEFEPTVEEAQRWMASADGQEALRVLREEQATEESR